MKNKNLNNLFIAGACLTFAGAVFALLDIKYSAFVFSAGALCVIFVRLANIRSQRLHADMRTRRLHNLQFLATIVLAAAAWFMFKNNNIWVVATLIYALITLFLSFREK